MSEVEDEMSLNSKPEKNLDIFTNRPINYLFQLNNVIPLQW